MVEENKKMLKVENQVGEKGLRHREFPGGLHIPSTIQARRLLNFRDQTRTGVFIVVWS